MANSPNQYLMSLISKELGHFEEPSLEYFEAQSFSRSIAFAQPYGGLYHNQTPLNCVSKSCFEEFSINPEESRCNNSLQSGLLQALPRGGPGQIFSRVIVTPAVYPRLIEFLHFDIQSTGQKSHCVNTKLSPSQCFVLIKQSDSPGPYQF